MDLFVVSKLLSRKSEAFQERSAPEQVKLLLIDTISFVVSLAISVFAAYLSWTCNTAMDRNIVVKIIYMTLAFMFGVVYLIFYALFSATACSAVKQQAARARR